MIDPSLLPFFSPRGVVVIGASTSPEKLGYGVARNLIHSGYPGAVHLVSQKREELFGRPLCTSLDQVPDPVDLAVIIVPPQAAPQAIQDCGQRGIRAAILMSSGFREVGPEGAALEQKCLDTARANGVRLLGPNCIGVIDTHLPLDATFLQPPMPARGAIGFISQSGAFCAAIVDWARGQGFGFSRILSLGNQADVNETDALAVLGEDETTRVIVLYMESVSDGKRFIEVARSVTRHKPILALKVGRFESGQRAAASHTGALAASDTAFEAAFEKAGILRAESAEQMFDWAGALAAHPVGLPLPATRDHGIAVLTNAGGPGVIAADALEQNGLSTARLHEPTIQTLIASLPPAASVFNPVDMLASASPDTYAACLQTLLEDSNVDGALVILPPPPMYEARDVAEHLVQIMKPGGLRLASREVPDSMDKKPVVVSLMGSTLIEEALAVFQQAKVPTYPFPERAASALGALARRAAYLASEPPSMEETVPRAMPGAQDIEELLAAYSIPNAPVRLARSLDEAAAAADAIGYPVVMKIASPDISHKSDVGGVVLGIADGPALLIAYTQMMERVRLARPGARIEGVHLQRQVQKGQEVIVGAVRDPQFGPLMMFGSGGVEVEGLRDVAFALAPLTEAEATRMIHKTWAGRKLAGFRDLPPADEASVVKVLVGLSHLVMDDPAIEEIEINPLRVLERGAVAVDVRMKRHGND